MLSKQLDRYLSPGLLRQAWAENNIMEFYYGVLGLLFYVSYTVFKH